jgi:hypothetical protein
MQGNEQVAELGVKYAAKWCGVRLETEYWWYGNLGACVVVEICGRGLHELLTDLKRAVRQFFGTPDCKADRIAIPVAICKRHIPQEVEFLSWVVRVYVYCGAVDGASQIISTIFGTPEPKACQRLIFFCMVILSAKGVHYILFPSNARPTSLRRPNPAFQPSDT